MSARPDTWMPMYWGDYARDTGHLNAAGHGAYLMLIKHYWCTGKPLPDDDELWRVACCDSKKEWLTLRPKIIRLFDVQDRMLHHKRIEHELAVAVFLTEQRRTAGKASAAARKNQRNVNENSTPVEHPLNTRSILVDVPLAVPLQHNGRPSQSPSQEEKETTLRVVQKPANRKTQIPPDWEPDADGIAYAKVRGLTPADVAHFRDHYRSQGKGMVDWDLTWKNWCRNAPKFGATPLLGLVSTKGVSV